MSNPRDPKRPASSTGDGDLPAEEQDFHATEDSIRADLARLGTIEATKTALAPADPEVDRLSDEAVNVADGLARKTRAERQLGQDLG
jgi:hypothetical protein